MTELTLDLLKEWLRYEPDDAGGNATLNVVLKAAVRYVEGQTGVLFTKRTVTHPVYSFKGPIKLFYGPTEGAVAFSYIDSAGETQAVDADISDGSRVYPPVGGWPVAGVPILAVYEAGYENPDEVPEDLLVAALLLAGNWDANREAGVTGVSVATLPMGVEALMLPYRTLLA